MKSVFRVVTFPSGLASVTVPCTAFAQSDATTDPAVLAAQTQQALLDAKLKSLQDQQAMLTGMLPSTSSTPNSGGYTVTGTAPFPSQKLAYDQLQNIAVQLVRSTPLASGAGPVIMYDASEVSNLLNYNALINMLGLLNDQSDSLAGAYGPLNQKAKDLQTLVPIAASKKDIAPILIPGLVLGGLKTVADIIGMFRTNTTIAYNSYTADDTALIAIVSKQFIGKRPVILPAQMPLTLNVNYAGSTFMQNLNVVQKKLFDLQIDISQDQGNLQQLSDALGAYIAADQAEQANIDAFNAESDAAKKAALGVKKGALRRATDVAKAYVLSLYKVAAPVTIDPP